MKTIPIFKSNLVAIVDDQDYESLIGFRWCLHDCGYAVRGGGHDKVYMHRQIMGFPKFKVDHRDRNPLNNLRDNLRKATKSQNNWNYKPEHRHNHGQSRTGFVGVSWDSIRKRWKAYISANYKIRWLGRFDSDIEAAMVRDAAAIKMHGEFASLNFPNPMPMDTFSKAAALMERQGAA
jgi:hypothetical protein